MSEVKDLKKSMGNSQSLKGYIELLYDRLIVVDHGERDRFYVPKHITSLKLNELFNMTNDQFNSRFSTTKTKVLSIMNRYIKDMQRGFEEHDLEENPTRSK